MADKKYYWLKLKRDFFKRHDMRIIEAMPNGKDYVLFYLKLLVESVDHNGELRFSDTIPYDDQMLSVIANTNIDVVKSAMKLFVNLQMIDILDDLTIRMVDVVGMTGTETYWAEQKRAKRLDNVQSKSNNNRQSPICPTDVQPMSTQELELELDKELYKNICPKTEKIPSNDILNIWNIYPKKEGRASAMKSIPKLIKKYGVEQITRCVLRYKEKVLKDKTEKQYIKQGSTFFNSGYMDYLDENFEDTTPKRAIDLDSRHRKG